MSTLQQQMTKAAFREAVIESGIDAISRLFRQLIWIQGQVLGVWPDCFLLTREQSAELRRIEAEWRARQEL